MAARTVPRSLLVVALAAVVPAVLVAVAGGHDFDGALLAASVIAGAGAGYALDDDAAVTLAPSPTSLARRRALRAVPVAAVLGLAWVSALALAALAGAPSRPPVAVLAAELAASAGVAGALASAGRTDGPVSPGAGAAAGALLLMVGIAGMAMRVAWLPSFGGGADHGRWWWVAAAGAAATAWSSRDPAAR